MLAASEYNTSAPNRMLEMDGMKFGLFFQFQVPRPWHARNEYAVFRNAIDQAALADTLGLLRGVKGVGSTDTRIVWPL